MKPQYRINFEDAGVEMVSIPLAEYEELKKLKSLVDMEKHLSMMYDSNHRIAMALLDKIRNF